MQIIISATKANSILENTKDLVIFDCRGDLNDKESGLKHYHAAHLPRAIFLDGEKDLSDQVSEHGGRHPLPQIERFVQKLRESGVNDTSTIIAYGLYAPRLIFMLNLIGLTQVHLIDGGFDSWTKSNYPTSNKTDQPQTGNLVPRFNNDLLVLMPEVLAKLDNAQTRLIDSRAPERYRGEVEPLDRIPGHIPGADNYFWQSNFDDAGFVKSDEELQNQLAAINLKPDEEKILYCGSGITAAYNYVVFNDLNIKCRMYAGSYSDWVSYLENQVRTSQK